MMRIILVEEARVGDEEGDGVKVGEAKREGD